MSRLGGLVMLIVGVYAVIGRFLLDGYMRRHLSYVVTDRRAIIARTGPWPTRLSLDLARLPHLELKEMPDGTGTILFGAPRPVRRPCRRATRIARATTGRAPRDEELAVLLRSLEQFRESFAKDPADAQAFAKAADGEVVNPAEAAPFVALAHLLLNLDETITKN